MPGVSDYNINYPLDPNADSDDASEFSWGPGLTPKGLENARRPKVGGTRVRVRRARKSYGCLDRTRQCAAEL
jgi:hypothetical protein